uniref:Uncharacterized protein n=1 Tax=Cacopsylla melanoneura TaxID=428564 RepID=A0A8D8RR83_9HEMI
MNSDSYSMDKFTFFSSEYLHTFPMEYFRYLQLLYPVFFSINLTFSISKIPYRTLDVPTLSFSALTLHSQPLKYPITRTMDVPTLCSSALTLHFQPLKYPIRWTYLYQFRMKLLFIVYRCCCHVW